MLGGQNPRGGARGLTKTQQLRQAKSAALVTEYEQRQESTRHHPDPLKTRKRITHEPKKVDFSKPTMTKAMLARMKQAEKFKDEYERKREEPSRRFKRTAAPIGGDARLGKEKVPKRPIPVTTMPAATPRIPATRLDALGPSSTLRRGASPQLQRRTEDKTTELARTMNADVLQAEPLGPGPIDNIVIPPGVVNDNRTTIVSIKQPGALTGAGPQMTSQVANRSIQVINESLDEQDAAESAAVQNKLEELQQARREFVIAVANVGGNAVNIGDETVQHATTSRHIVQRPLEHSPHRCLYRVPDIEEEAFQVEYGRDHPHVKAARDFMQKRIADMKEREAAQRIEQEFERIAQQSDIDDLQLNAPFDEEFLYEGDLSWEQDEETGMDLPYPSRVKSTMPPIPKRQDHYQYDSFDPDELERFFDVQRYPPCPMHAPPQGREHLNPDLWELDDPWYRPPPESDMPNLIDFDT